MKGDHSFWQATRKQGFTLVELLVVIGVVVMLALMLLVSFPKFTRTLEVSRAVQEISLTLRDAESRAMGVKTEDFTSTTDFPVAYGVYFNEAEPQHYFLFADTVTANCVYDAGEEVTEYKLSSRIRIGELSANTSLAPGALHLLFRRPDPTIEARDSGDCSALLAQNNFNVEIISADGAVKKTVTLWTTGQVEISQ